MRLTTSSQKMDAMLEYAEAFAYGPTRYDVLSNNCQSFVNGVLAAGGISLGYIYINSDASLIEKRSLASNIVPNQVFDYADHRGSSGVPSLEKIAF